MPRTKLIAANWKMYKTPDQTHAFFRDFLPQVSGHTRDEIVVCPPYTDLAAAVGEPDRTVLAASARTISRCVPLLRRSPASGPRW